MAIQQDFIDYLIDQMSDFGEVYAKRMFGGVGFFHEGLMFGMIGADVLRLKADAVTEPDYKAQDMQPFFPYGDDRSMPYWEVPAGIIEDKAQLASWAEKAFEVALRSKKKK